MDSTFLDRQTSMKEPAVPAKIKFLNQDLLSRRKEQDFPRFEAGASVVILCKFRGTSWISTIQPFQNPGSNYTLPSLPYAQESKNNMPPE
jgi:hypothetical protein